MTIQIRQTGPTTSEAAIRNHTVVVDRPVEKGGTDAGPMGGELFLAAVGGCFVSTLLAAIRARSAGISDVRAEVGGTIDGAPPQFTRIDIAVSAATSDDGLLEKLVTVAEQGCIMVNTLRGKIDLRVRIAG
jgi:putative redox protein